VPQTAGSISAAIKEKDRKKKNKKAQDENIMACPIP